MHKLRLSTAAALDFYGLPYYATKVHVLWGIMFTLSSQSTVHAVREMPKQVQATVKGGGAADMPGNDQSLHFLPIV